MIHSSTFLEGNNPDPHVCVESCKKETISVSLAWRNSIRNESVWRWREGKTFLTLIFSFSQVQVETLKEPKWKQRIKRLWFQISKELCNTSDYSRLHEFRIFVKGSDDVSVFPFLPTQVNSVFRGCGKSTFTLEQLMLHPFLGALCCFHKIKLLNKVTPWWVYLPVLFSHLQFSWRLHRVFGHRWCKFKWMCCNHSSPKEEEHQSQI